MNLSQRIGLSTLSVRDSQRLNEEHAIRVREAQEAAQIAAFSCEITLDAVRNGVKNTVMLENILNVFPIMLDDSNMCGFLDYQYAGTTKNEVSVQPGTQT